MFKNLNFVLWAILAMVLIASCAPKPTAPAAKPDVAAPADAGESTVDEVAEDISDVADADDKLDASELDDVDGILADIENI